MVAPKAKSAAKPKKQSVGKPKKSVGTPKKSNGTPKKGHVLFNRQSKGPPKISTAKYKKSTGTKKSSGTPKNQSAGTPKNQGAKGIKLGKYRLNPLIAIIIALVIVIIMILSAVLIMKFTGLGGFLDSSKLNKARNVCETPECIHLAHQLHNWGDQKADPCSDFYKFTCGKHSEHHAATMGPIYDKMLNYQKLMAEFFHDRIVSPTQKSELALRLLFQKCVTSRFDKKTREQELGRGLVEVMQKIETIGKWPTAGNGWDSSKFDLNLYLIHMATMKIPLNGLFYLQLGRKLTILANNAAVENPLKLSPDLKSFIYLILQVNNHAVDNSTIDSDIAAVVSLDNLIRSRFVSQPERKTYSELKQSVPGIKWDVIFKQLTNQKNRDLDKVLSMIQVESSELFFGPQKLDDLLKMDTRTTANYIIFYYISYVASITDLPSAKSCVEYVMTQLPQACLRYFVRHYFDKENIKVVSDMVKNIKEGFTEMFQKTTWISGKAKQKALLKLEKMTHLVGYPADSGWEDQVEKYFEQYDLKPEDSLFTLAEKIMKLDNDNFFDLLLLQDELFPLPSRMGEANALYVPNMNHLLVTVPFMDDPNFDTTYPKFAQLAIVGRSIGHEIAHGFDNIGINFDENGVFIQRANHPWALNEFDEYIKRATCLVDQYDNYDDPFYGKVFKGDPAVGEMLADQIGFEAAWLAFQKIKSESDADIVGYEGYDVDKMFFRVSSLMWCEPRFELETLPISHPRGRFRINGVYSNTRAFAKTFSCPVGTPMNPEKKCEIF